MRGRCVVAHAAAATMRSSIVEHSSERPIACSAWATAALRAGYRLLVLRGLRAALRQWLRAVAVSAPRRQEHAIAEPQCLEASLVLPPTEPETALLERDAVRPRVGPRASDFSDPDFRSLTARRRAVPAAQPLLPAGGCATRVRGCLGATPLVLGPGAPARGPRRPSPDVLGVSADGAPWVPSLKPRWSRSLCAPRTSSRPSLRCAPVVGAVPGAFGATGRPSR